MQLPVALRARELGHRVTILALTTAAKDVAAAGVDYIGYNDLWNFAAKGAKQYGEDLCKDMDRSGPVSWAETVAYHGINFSELVSEVGETEAYFRFRLQGRHAFLPTSFMSRVLAKLRPDVVIASNSPRSEQAAITAAGQLMIPAVCIVDLFALQEYKWIAQPRFADKVCVLNESVGQFLVSHGRSDRDLVVTGNPAFDKIMQPETVQAGHVLNRTRGWDDGKINILWASQVEPSIHPFDDLKGDPMLPRKIELILREIVSERDDMRLIVRYHPSENVNFAPARNVESSPRTEPLHALLHAVDLVVVTASTVGLEAHIAGRPVISVDLSVFTRDAPYSSSGIATGVSSLDELREVMRNYSGEQTNSSLSGSKSVTALPLNATEAVLNVIESLTFHTVE
ncbi:hypothetical protein [Sphingorhabdus sp.]|uniref:hypothetical protein n=1 Tax=Sphingorhabdus sp. TaxID=1902408 RepID=UPI00391C5B1C